MVNGNELTTQIRTRAVFWFAFVVFARTYTTVLCDARSCQPARTSGFLHAVLLARHFGDEARLHKHPFLQIDSVGPTVDRMVS